MARIAINGLGRIGKLVLRALVEEGAPGEIVLLNDPAATRPSTRCCSSSTRCTAAGRPPSPTTPTA